jgi:SAM-dependent methyltransferase
MDSLYEKTAEKYDKRHENATTRHLRKRERNILRKHAKGLVLDVGCGTGEYADFADIGIDPSSSMIKEAMKKSKRIYCAAKAEALPFKDGSFDSLICMFTVLNLCDYRKAASEMKRVVKENGTVIISVASVWDRKDYTFRQKLRNRHDSDVKNIRIEKNRMRFKLFTKRELTGIFQNQGFFLKEMHGIFKWQNPRWNKYADFSTKERIKLAIERMLPTKAARIYIAVFRKA